MYTGWAEGLFCCSSDEKSDGMQTFLRQHYSDSIVSINDRVLSEIKYWGKPRMIHWIHFTKILDQKLYRKLIYFSYSLSIKFLTVNYMPWVSQETYSRVELVHAMKQRHWKFQFDRFWSTMYHMHIFINKYMYIHVYIGLFKKKILF